MIKEAVKGFLMTVGLAAGLTAAVPAAHAMRGTICDGDGTLYAWVCYHTPAGTQFCQWTAVGCC